MVTTVKTTLLTGNILVDALLSTEQWNSDLTYSFPNENSFWGGGYGAVPSLTALNNEEQQQFHYGLNLWASVANIKFTEIAEVGSRVGDIRVTHDGDIGGGNAYGYAYTPTFLYPDTLEAIDYAGDIWLNNADYSEGISSGSLHVLVHEIGHALGLEHPHHGNTIMPLSQDNTQFSIMSYKHHQDTIDSNYNDYVTTPMLYDIAAVQSMYGANLDYHAGNDVYQFTTDGEILAVWDGGGVDSFDFSNQTKGVTISLVEGVYNSVGFNDNAGRDASNNLVIAFNAVIENATGSRYADNLTGNDASNILTGGQGNDVLNGGNGGDIAYYNSNYDDATISFNTDGSIKVRSAEGRDTLISIESVQFLDGFVDVADGILEARAVNSEAVGRVISLYQAGLNREPDSGGMNFWIDAYSNGFELLTISQDFINSNEFNTFFDVSTNESYVDTLYQNVLGREGETAGFDFWVNGLNNGATQAQVLLDFSDSVENQLQIAPLLAGLQYQADDGVWLV